MHHCSNAIATLYLVLVAHKDTLLTSHKGKSGLTRPYGYSDIASLSTSLISVFTPYSLKLKSHCLSCSKLKLRVPYLVTGCSQSHNGNLLGMAGNYLTNHTMHRGMLNLHAKLRNSTCVLAIVSEHPKLPPADPSPSGQLQPK